MERHGEVAFSGRQSGRSSGKRICGRGGRRNQRRRGRRRSRPLYLQRRALSFLAWPLALYEKESAEGAAGYLTACSAGASHEKRNFPTSGNCTAIRLKTGIAPAEMNLIQKSQPSSPLVDVSLPRTGSLCISLYTNPTAAAMTTTRATARI